MKKISIIIPVYNEKNTVLEVIERVFSADTRTFQKEIVVVNDGSSDGTDSVLSRYTGKVPFIYLSHKNNKGKGAAIRSALRRSTGDIVLIQDADLELTPDDYPSLIEAYSETSPVVYGSRNLLRQKHTHTRVLYAFGGRFLTSVFNLLYGTRLTDINTAYKLFKAEIIRSADLKSDGFEFCEEITAKVTKMGYPIREIPIKYNPRTFSDGKKLRMKDGAIGLWTIVRLRFPALKK